MGVENTSVQQMLVDVDPPVQMCIDLDIQYHRDLKAQKSAHEMRESATDHYAMHQVGRENSAVRQTPVDVVAQVYKRR